MKRISFAVASYATALLAVISLPTCCTVGFAQVNLAVNLAGLNADSQEPQTVAVQKSSETAKPGQQDARKANSRKATDKKSTDKKQLPTISKQRRVELMTFVRANHPELRPLLNSLEKRRPDQFQSALRTLDREVKVLQSQKQRAPARYKRSLEQWIVKSKIKLLSAQLALNKSEKEKSALRNRIKALITKQQDLKIEQTSSDIEQLTNRLRSLEGLLKELESNRENEIQMQLYSITKTAQRIQAAQKKAAAAKRKQSQNSRKSAVRDGKNKSQEKDN